MRKGEIACYKQFSFSHNIFHSYISLIHQNAALCGHGLISLFGQFLSHEIHYDICSDDVHVEETAKGFEKMQ